MLAIATVLLKIVLSAPTQQGCALSGHPAWSNQVRHLIADCELKLSSPDSKLSLVVDADGKIRVSQGGTVLHEKRHIAPVEPPAMVSWSPASNAFFINDGEGSGMTSVFRMFRIGYGEIVEEPTIQKRAVAFFRKIVRCRPEAVDPNVDGFGWSADGREIYLLVQSTVHNPCGPSGTFISLIVGADDTGIREQLSERGTERRFRNLLPAELFRK